LTPTSRDVSSRTVGLCPPASLLLLDSSSLVDGANRPPPLDTAVLFQRRPRLFSRAGVRRCPLPLPPGRKGFMPLRAESRFLTVVDFGTPRLCLFFFASTPFAPAGMDIFVFGYRPYFAPARGPTWQSLNNDFRPPRFLFTGRTTVGSVP